MFEPNLVEFEDLSLLEANDLRDVLYHVSPDTVLEAFVGAMPHYRQLILTKLAASQADLWKRRIDGHGPVSNDAAVTAQRRLIETARSLGRIGQIAFDDPADMVA